MEHPSLSNEEFVKWLVLSLYWFSCPNSEAKYSKEGIIVQAPHTTLRDMYDSLLSSGHVTGMQSAGLLSYGNKQRLIAVLKRRMGVYHRGCPMLDDRSWIYTPTPVKNPDRGSRDILWYMRVPVLITKKGVEMATVFEKNVAPHHSEGKKYTIG